MSVQDRVKGRRKWWDSLPAEERFKRMQALSRKKWAAMSPAQRKAHGERLRQARRKARLKLKKLKNS